MTDTIDESKVEAVEDESGFALMEGFDFSGGLNTVRQVIEETKGKIENYSYGWNIDKSFLTNLKEAQESFLEAVKETKNFVQEKGGPVEEVEAAAMKILQYNLNFHRSNRNDSGNISSDVLSVWRDSAAELREFREEEWSIPNPEKPFSLKEYFNTEYANEFKGEPVVILRQNDEGASPSSPSQTTMQTAGKVAGAAAGLYVAGKFTSDLLGERQQKTTAEGVEDSLQKPGKFATFAKVAMVAVGVTLAGGFVASLMGKDVTSVFRRSGR